MAIKNPACPHCGILKAGIETSIDHVFMRCGNHRCGAAGPRVIIKHFEDQAAAEAEARRLWKSRTGVDDDIVNVPVYDPAALSQ